jgi:signal transduction histidine kinase
MSHEVRTPLNVILGLADVVEERLAELGDTSLAPLFGASRRAAERLLRTIHNVLDLAQLEAGTFRTSPRWLRIEEIVGRCRGEFESRASEKGLRFVVAVELGSRAELWCDEGCLLQALEALLDNAVKFTARGEVALRLKPHGGGGLEFEIRDTGIGIAPDHLSHLFEPFRQEELGPNRSFQGLGLGLALAKRYLELEEAELSAESSRGLGSVFRIRFPAGRVRF